MIGGLNVAAIAFGLAACAVTFAVVELVDGALHWIENRRAPQLSGCSRTARPRAPSST
jgi:hypothetical protein